MAGQYSIEVRFLKMPGICGRLLEALQCSRQNRLSPRPEAELAMT